MSLGSRKDAQPGQGAEGPLQPLLPPQSPGQVDSIRIQAPAGGEPRGCSEPFCIRPLLPGSKGLRAQPRPLSSPAVTRTSLQQDSRSPAPPLEEWPALSGPVRRGGVVPPHADSLRLDDRVLSPSWSRELGGQPHLRPLYKPQF